MRLGFDPAVTQVDLPRIREEVETREGWQEFEEQLQRALQVILRRPEEGKECVYPPLQGFRKFKFHSRKPSRKDKPDLRLIYEIAGDDLVVLAIGRRRPRQPNDVYRIAGKRLPAD